MNYTLKEGRINRQVALDEGQKHYESKACKRCETTTRYTANGSCVTCSIYRASQRYHGQDEGQSFNQTYNQVQWRENRQRAREQGATTYNGKACKTCENMVRYTLNKACIKCHARIGAAGRKRRVATNPEERNRWAKENRVRAMVGSARSRAKARGLDFELDHTEITIPEYCPVLGIRLSWEGDKANSPSLDRIDNEKGYTRENTRVISTRANLLKGNATMGELQAILGYMHLNLV